MIEALAAEALVLASRQAMGLAHTRRGLRVRSPLDRPNFSSSHVRIPTVLCAMRRNRKTDGMTSTTLSVSITAM